MIPYFAPSQNPAKSPLILRSMLPPSRPTPVELVLKLAQKSLNDQLTLNDNSLWSQNELNWIAQMLPQAQRHPSILNEERLQKASTMKKSDQLGPTKLKHWRAWTQEDFKTLKALYNQKLSMDEIAQRLGRTKTACSHKLWYTKSQERLNRESISSLPQRDIAKEEAALALISLLK